MRLFPVRLTRNRAARALVREILGRDLDRASSARIVRAEPLDFNQLPPARGKRVPSFSQNRLQQDDGFGIETDACRLPHFSRPQTTSLGAVCGTVCSLPDTSEKKCLLAGRLMVGVETLDVERQGCM